MKGITEEEEERTKVRRKLSDIWMVFRSPKYDCESSSDYYLNNTNSGAPTALPNTCIFPAHILYC